MDSSVLVSIISMVGGVITAYITSVLAKKVAKKKSQKQPKDRIEQMFDGYERLIKQKDREDERKARLMHELEEELIITRKMVAKLEASLALTQQELEISRQENRELRGLLQKMRQEYVEDVNNICYNNTGNTNTGE